MNFDVHGTSAIDLVISRIPTVVANLPAATSVALMSTAFVTNANATTFGTTVVGGGSNSVPVYSNGTNWLIG